MNFYIQDPSFSSTYSIHEALLKACDGAECGGGAYAFVSADGAKLFLEDDSFKQMVASGGAFKIIVGMDEITNERAVTKLIEIRNKYKGKLEVFAFLQEIQERKESLFHPKFSWFKKGNGGELVVGSGNLTEKGLRRNREAFSVATVDAAKLTEVVDYWNHWLEHNSRYLENVDSDKVMEQAKLNKLTFSKMKESYGKAKETSVKVLEETTYTIEDEEKETWVFNNETPVFVTEINKNGTRPTQVNLNRKDFEQFFGGDSTRRNKNYRVLFRHVLPNGLLADLEIRPGVPVKSNNYRFELDAMSEHSYPLDLNTRPIGVFIKVSTRDFLYIIAWPTDRFYNDIKNFLYENTKITRADRMKNFQAEVQNLQAKVPYLPFWKIS